jgi:hypothetical protein
MDKTKSECQEDKNSKATEPTIEEVEGNLFRIMKDEKNTKEQKRQELLKLSGSIGLPQHSADMHCIVLTYSQAFEQIQKWIQNKRTDQYTRKMVKYAWFSVLSALAAIVISIIAILVSIWIWHKTLTIETNKGELKSIEEATGTSYTKERSLLPARGMRGQGLAVYKDCIVIVGQMII